MKKIILLLLIWFLFIVNFNFDVNASIFWWTTAPTPVYCKSGTSCWITEWINQVKDANWLPTNTKFSDYVQDIVVYLLKFLAIVATLLIIYAWFNLLTSVWDEEKSKKSKSIIIYALLWLLIIFLAWPITNFIIAVLDA